MLMRRSFGLTQASSYADHTTEVAGPSSGDETRRGVYSCRPAGGSPPAGRPGSLRPPRLDSGFVTGAGCPRRRPPHAWGAWGPSAIDGPADRELLVPGRLRSTW